MDSLYSDKKKKKKGGKNKKAMAVSLKFKIGVGQNPCNS